MQLLFSHDDGSFSQKDQADMEDEDLQQHNHGEVTILALKDGKFCTAAIDSKGDGSYEIVAWNPV